MKKTILVTGLTVLLTAAPAVSQMMGEGQHMYGGQDAKSRQQMQQTDPAGGQTYQQYMNPGMMGSYGYGMGPQMMGGGYGMNPGMMGGYGMYPGMMGGGYGYGMGQGMMGYGMHPGMMGGYGCGYGMNPGMMGGQGYGMGPGMMGYGMGSGMMQGYGMGYGMYPGMMGYGSQEDYKKYKDKQEKFLEETKELRRKLHSMKFDFSEEAAKPEANREKLQKMEKEMNELYEKIREKAIQ